MSENGKHLAYCRKEKEIAEIYTKVNRIEKVVMDGNGNEALSTCVPKLSDNVETLTDRVIPDLKIAISGFHQFQSEQEGRHEGKESMRKRTRYIIGTLISVCSLLLVVVGILIGKLMV
jgi:hypothetical protein